MRTSVINHPENEALIIIRKWQLIYCEGNEVAAALLSFFEYWYNIKVDIADQNKKANDTARQHGDTPAAVTSLYQWHTEAELIAGIQRIAKTGKTLTKGIDILIGKGAITIHKNPNPVYKFDKKRYFLFYPESINAWLKNGYPLALKELTSSSSKITSSSSKITSSSSKNPSAITETTNTESSLLKASSANADCSRPISLLSEKEIKDKTKDKHFSAEIWETWLADEQSERNRKGVIKFLGKKIATRALLPDTLAARILFDKLQVEADAKSRRPPETFPTLAVKEKFGKAADELNGTLEIAITKALESGITTIPRIVNYISSPKWREPNGQRTTKTGQRQTNGQTPQRTGKFSPPADSGQTPEMAKRLREAFAPK